MYHSLCPQTATREIAGNGFPTRKDVHANRLSTQGPFPHVLFYQFIQPNPELLPRAQPIASILRAQRRRIRPRRLRRALLHLPADVVVQVEGRLIIRVGDTRHPVCVLL
jgi:hypothetical protein